MTCSINYKLQDLKRSKTVSRDLLFKDDLNKIKTLMMIFSSAVQNTNDRFKNSNKKNTETA